MNTPLDPASQPAATPNVRRVPAARIAAWLHAGWRDVVANPIPSLAYGLLFGIGGDLILLASIGRPHLFWRRSPASFCWRRCSPSVFMN